MVTTTATPCWTDGWRWLRPMAGQRSTPTVSAERWRRWRPLAAPNSDVRQADSPAAGIGLGGRAGGVEPVSRPTPPAYAGRARRWSGHDHEGAARSAAARAVDRSAGGRRRG